MSGILKNRFFSVYGFQACPEDRWRRCWRGGEPSAGRWRMVLHPESRINTGRVKGWRGLGIERKSIPIPTCLFVRFHQCLFYVWSLAENLAALRFRSYAPHCRDDGKPGGVADKTQFREWRQSVPGGCRLWDSIIKVESICLIFMKNKKH